MGYGKKAGKGSQGADSWLPSGEYSSQVPSRGWGTKGWEADDWSAGKNNNWGTASQTKAAPRKGKGKDKTKGKGKGEAGAEEDR
jgi:hypothetical protein